MTNGKDMGPNFELSRKREIRDGNSGLPKGAVKCSDAEIEKLLQEMHIENIRFYNDTQICINGGLFTLKSYEAEASGSKNKTFNNQLHPEVEGYNWYRGFAIKVDNGMVFIFTGMMQPWREGGSPDCIIYSTGYVSRKDVLKVVNVYCSGMLSCFADTRLEIKKREAIFEARKAYKKAKAKGMNNMNALEMYNNTFNTFMKNE